MKSKNKNAGITLCVALPLLLLLVGCNSKVDSSTEGSGSAISDRGTNATMADADNSQKNVRDRNDATLTAGDQGNSEADRDITQNVRKMLVSGPTDYSMAAKNIKIVTINGKITLRGPVNTTAERTAIATIAESVAGVGNVDNQLEVKTNP